MPTMNAKFPGTCSVCRNTISVGQTIFFDPHAPKHLRARHSSCGATKPPEATRPDEKPAGSVQLEYECRENYELITARPHELFDLVKTPPTQSSNAALWHKRYGAENANVRSDWRGGTVAELIAMRDWPQGRELMALYGAELLNTPEATSIRRVRRWSEDGDDFSRDRFDSGYFDCWSRRVRTSQPARSGVIHITVQFGGNADVSAENLAWGGAAAAVLVDKLEDAGYRCEVTAFACTCGSRTHRGRRPNTLAVRVPIKAADESLDLDRLLMVTSRPGFFRCHIFRTIMDLDSAVNSSLGSNGSMPDDLKGDIHFGNVHSKEAAQAELNRILESFANPEPVNA